VHIILGVDDSACSRTAAEFVRGMRWPDGCTATVVNALPQVSTANPEAYLVMAAQMEELRREQREANGRSVARIAADLGAAGIAAKGVVADGDPRIALVDAARREKADLLVVGSHGRTGLTKLVLGSVASHVTTHAPCSVLVVRAPLAGGTP